MAVARQLRTGVTFFNNHNATAVDERAPFGGFNQSGLGRELGREGLLSSPRPTSWPSPTGRPRTRQSKAQSQIFRTDAWRLWATRAFDQPASGKPVGPRAAPRTAISRS